MSYRLAFAWPGAYRLHPMSPRTLRLTALCTLVFTGIARGKVDFAHEVLPILKEHCAECHTNGKYKGSLSMDTREALLNSDSVVVGKSGESLLIKLLRAEDPDDRMPQKAEPLPAEKIATLERWIDEGLPWEPGFTFREKTWKAPLAPRNPKLPPARSAGENPIDRIAREYFKSNKVKAPGAIPDPAFLRRVQLDLLGLLPTPGELKAFEASTEDRKRAAKVHELLARKIDYADHWMTFWNDLLRNDYAGTGFIDGGRKQITGWLYHSLHENKPYDQFVRELMSPSGDSEGFIRGIKWRGNVNASQVQEVQYAQNVSQVFFGENLKCASCHDSFINDWKLADAYGMAAIIAGKPLEMFRCDKATGEFADAKFLFPSLGEIDKSAPKEARLKRAAELATARGNGRLARTVVNRLWARLMGRGLVEPVDIMGNRPWSEDMLDFLAWDLAESGYDLKRTLALIATSRTYQSATAAPPGEAEEYVFRGPIAKRMTAEQFIDAVWEVTGTAPGKIDAKVQRPIGGGGNAGGGKLPGTWIWSAKGSRPAGETVVFTRDFELPADSAPQLVALTCDNEYTLKINGKKVGSGTSWEQVDRYGGGELKPGKNRVEVHGKNAGGGPNAAGLYVAIVVATQDERLIISTDKRWLADGKPAIELGDGPWGSRVNPQIAQHLSTPARERSEHTPRARASLVKSTLLMRALGRPNREQVVTTRPDTLTTLQALELNNGAEFVGYLKRGASNLFGQYSGRYDEMVEQLYLTMLSREPTGAERSVALEILGRPATQEGVADLLWTLLMLPEFQFVN